MKWFKLQRETIKLATVVIICTNLQEETQTQLAALFQKINLAASVLIKTVGGNVLQDKTDSALCCAVWGGRWEVGDGGPSTICRLVSSSSRLQQLKSAGIR